MKQLRGLYVQTFFTFRTILVYGRDTLMFLLLYVFYSTARH